MDQRMILGNGSSHDMTHNSLDGALESRELQYLQGNIQHAPFKLPITNTDSAISSQASLSGYQNSIFETPPSIHNSPQFNSVLNTPIVTPLQGNLAVACCVCGSECGRGHGFQLSTCNHIYCNHCISLTIGQHGRFCTLCFATNMALESAYMRQMPTQRGQEDLTSLFSSRLQFNDALMSRPSALLENSFGNHTPFSQRFDSLNKDSSSHFLFNSNSDTVRAPVFSPSSTLQKSRTCIGCNEGASHYCENCQESLCGDCVVAHQRVRFTRDHHIARLPMPDHSEYLKEPVDQSRSLSSSKLEDPHIMHSTFATKMDHACPLHKENAVVARCESCPSVIAQPLCVKCLPDHPRPQHHVFPIGDLKSTIVHFLREARHEERALTDAMAGLQHMSERVEASVGSTINDVRAEIHRHISALEERKRELLQKIETIHLSKQALLKAQSDRILSRKHKLTHVYKFVENLEDNETNLMMSFNQLVDLFTAYPPSLVPNEIDLIRYLAPDATLVENIRNLGDLESGPSALTSGILGETAQKIVLDRYTTILVQLRDACGTNVSFSGYVQFVLVKLIQPDGTMLDLGISERSIGIVAINFVPKMEGIHHLHIQIHGMNIKGAPIQLEVRRGRNYQDISNRGELFSFGKEGSEDGELCRPWGICCDHKGRIIVADRSNNRIQIFDPEGKFLQKFGSGGNKPGQFDRPAGVCVNTHNQIIVADKDNHRVQVFDNDGNFVFKFGERGRPQGMFNYPWGVATNAHNEIAVSDTRNHRVQIFSSTGEFLLKCGFDTAYFYKHLDSPRGVCYLPNGQLLITDFNNHRVVLMGPKGGPDMKCYGSEGDQEGLFLRPQGIAIDMEGHILVCDSRNNRIQVFASEDMRCVSVFGGAKLALSPHINHVNKSPTQDTSLRSLPSVTPMQGGSSLDFSSPPPTNTMTVTAPIPPFSPNATLNETPGSSVALLDRPTDLCIGLDGRIYVVDFGNNCIRVF